VRYDSPGLNGNTLLPSLPPDSAQFPKQRSVWEYLSGSTTSFSSFNGLFVGTRSSRLVTY
jgi:hypothetical protein